MVDHFDFSSFCLFLVFSPIFFSIHYLGRTHTHTQTIHGFETGGFEFPLFHCTVWHTDGEWKEETEEEEMNGRVPGKRKPIRVATVDDLFAM